MYGWGKLGKVHSYLVPLRVCLCHRGTLELILQATRKSPTLTSHTPFHGICLRKDPGDWHLILLFSYSPSANGIGSLL